MFFVDTDGVTESVVPALGHPARYRRDRGVRRHSPAAAHARQRRLSKSLSRKQNGSAHRRQADIKLGRHHYRTTNIRRHFLHQVSGALTKTHDRLVIEDLKVAGMLRNHRLAQAIQMPAGPSSSAVFTCGCGHCADRDLNAATNLARWGQAHHDPDRSPDPQAGGRVTNAADGTALTSTPRVPVKPARMTREPTFTPTRRPESTTPEKGGARHSTDVRHALELPSWHPRPTASRTDRRDPC